jgi:hypothetical protein
MQQPPDTLSAKYTLTCQAKECEGIAVVTQNLGVRWKVGDIVSMDPTNPVFARCPQCKRHNMMVTQVPTAPLPPKPKGFTKVPTE